MSGMSLHPYTKGVPIGRQVSIIRILDFNRFWPLTAESKKTNLIYERLEFKIASTSGRPVWLRRKVSPRRRPVGRNPQRLRGPDISAKSVQTPYPANGRTSLRWSVRMPWYFFLLADRHRQIVLSVQRWYGKKIRPHMSVWLECKIYIYLLVWQ